MPGCEVSTVMYAERLTLCAPQKIKERLISYLIEGGLSAEGRKYDIRDFWIITQYGYVNEFDYLRGVNSNTSLPTYLPNICELGILNSENTT